jgi:hypothetical protein
MSQLPKEGSWEWEKIRLRILRDDMVVKGLVEELKKAKLFCGEEAPDGMKFHAEYEEQFYKAITAYEEAIKEK